MNIGLELDWFHNYKGVHFGGNPSGVHSFYIKTTTTTLSIGAYFNLDEDLCYKAASALAASALAIDTCVSAINLHQCSVADLNP